MRYRAEKTTKQIENEELSRLTEATTQGAEGRPTTQLDPDALRALLGTDEMLPVTPPPPVAPPVVEAAVVVEVPPLVVEALPVQRARWGVVICVVIAGAAAALATRSFW